MRIYLHRENHHDAELVEAAENTSIAQALGIGDGTIALLEDADDALDPELRVGELPDRAHVFLGRPRHVRVAVIFNGEERSRTFSPSARVKMVFRWATGKQAFDLSDADAAEHTLALPDGTLPPSDVHLGSLDDATPGRLQFSLIPKHRFEG